MAHISDTITSLSGGVSQQPPRLRDPSKASEVVNGWATASGGVAKRPPLQNIGTVSEDPGGYTSGLVEYFVRGNNDRYRVVVANGDLKVFDADTGEEKTVYFPDGKGYLEGSEGFRAVSVRDRMWILNRDKTIEVLEERSPQPVPHGLIYIRQADFGTTYEIQLDGWSMSFQTPFGNSPVDRAQIDTTEVARAFLERLNSFFPYFYSNFEGEQFGSTIVIRRKDGRDFRLTGSDGLADRGMVVVKGSVQRFEDLPLRAKNGLVVEVTGDPGSEDDNYWVRYDDRGTPEKDGVWREIAKPGTRTLLDPSTMPHILQLGGAFTDPLEALPYPPTPTVARGSVSEAYAEWSERGYGGGGDPTPILERTDLGLTRDNEYAAAVISSAYGGQTRHLTATFGLNTLRVPPGTRVVVSLWQVGGGMLARRVYQSAAAFRDETLEADVTIPPGGATFRLVMNYGTGDTPDNEYERAVLMVRGLNAGLRHYSWTSQVVTIPDDDLYPEGWKVEVEVGANIFPYTVTGGPQSAQEVAAGLASALPSATADGNRVTIETTNEVSVRLAWEDSTHLYTDSALPEGAYEGLTLRNLTDGSEGTIVSTVGGLVIVDGLSGGKRNRFEPGDECEISANGDYFVFRRASWVPREAGSEERCPFPSFVGRKGREIFFTADRLGITAGNSVVLSRAGNHTAFVRQTARMLLDSDVIDVESGGRRVAEFHAALEWDRGIYLMSDLGLYRLGGEPLLSPKTVSLGLVAELPNDPSVQPVVAGSRIYYVYRGPSGVQVMEATVRQNLQVEADNLAVDIPSYIQGRPLALAVDPSLGVLTLLTDAGLYVYTYYDAPGYGRVLSAWSRWELPYGASDVALHEGVLTVVTARANGVYLGEIVLTGDLPTGADAYRDTVGEETFDYGFEYRFSPLFVRNEYGRIIPGDLRVLYVELHYHNTTGLTLTVQPEGRREYVYTREHPEASDGSLRVPVGAKDFTLTLTDSGNGPCAVSSLDWEGQFFPRQHAPLRQER